MINWKDFNPVKDPNGLTGLQRHYQKHVIKQQEFGDISQNEYLKKAKAFGKETGGIIGEVDEGNFKIKHNPETGEVFIGHTKNVKLELTTLMMDVAKTLLEMR
ncbi:hypothetical protein AAG747_05690 [Rapidithrix thailandica]|uniref:Uncharacterized protein n=1 Tax=Rapidithrix thailandica TaxID=413964 RepID=A0AAW9S1B6_9BACT